MDSMDRLQADLIAAGVIKPETDLRAEQAQAQPELVRGVGVISPPQSYKGHKRANTKPRGWSGRTVGTACNIDLDGSFIPILTAQGKPTVRVIRTVPSGFSTTQIVPASMYRRRSRKRQTVRQTVLDRAVPETAQHTPEYDQRDRDYS